MKKTIFIIMALMFLFMAVASFASCNGTTTDPTESSSDESSSRETTTRQTTTTTERVTTTQPPETDPPVFFTITVVIPPHMGTVPQHTSKEFLAGSTINIRTEFHTQPLPDTTFTFNGWFTTANFAPGTNLESQQQTNFLVTGNITLFARYIDPGIGLGFFTFLNISPTTAIVSGIDTVPGDGHVVIPPVTLDGRTVVGIANRAFMGTTGNTIVSVEFPDTLIFIGDEAFKDCIKLESVVIPKNVMSLGTEIFRGCSELLTVTFEANSALIAIPANAFRGTTKLNDVIFGENSSLIQINREAFRESGIRSIRIPNSVLTIRELAFADTPRLTTFTLQASHNLRVIGSYAFMNTPVLIRINIPTSVIAMGTDVFASTGSAIDVRVLGGPNPALAPAPHNTTPIPSGRSATFTMVSWSTNSGSPTTPAESWSTSWNGLGVGGTRRAVNFTYFAVPHAS